MAAIDPKDFVFEYAEAVWVVQEEVVGEDLGSLEAVVVARFDVVKVGVGEVEPFFGEIDAETVRPVDFGADYDGAVGTVEGGALDSRPSAPV